jgi:hypothetical protein
MTLDVLSVEAFTAGRLHRDDPETQRQIDVALGTARRYCGWHVTPSIEETVILDGPGGPTLVLPTLHVGVISEIVECGTHVEIADVTWSRRGMVAKRSGGRWTTEFSGIQVTYTHGFDTVADFDSMIRAAIGRGGFESADANVRVIGPFQYGTDSASAAGPSFSLAERDILDLYRLERTP